MSGVGQPRTQPERRHHRQSKRQERGKRGAWIDPHGYDAGKKIKGKKRHILVDTQGLLLHALVHSADIQDRDGGVLVMATLFGLHPFLLKLYADGGYQGPIFQSAVRKILRQIDVEIVKRSDTAKGFAVLPKRWIDCLAQSLPPLGQGLGVPQPKGLGVLAPCLNPPHAQKALSKNSMIPDRLSDKGAVREADYPHWNGYVETYFSAAWG